MPGHTRDWTMKNELDFLKGLGTWRPKGIVGREERDQRALIRGYIEGLHNRTYWNGLKKAPLLNMAYSMLASLP